MRTIVMLFALCASSACSTPPPDTQPDRTARHNATAGSDEDAGVPEEDAGIRADLVEFLRPSAASEPTSDRNQGDPDTLSLAEQHLNAAHEAAHVMADTYCFGREFVESISVAETVKGKFGSVDEVGFANAMTAEQIRCNTVAYLAGRAADEIINRAPDSGSMGDVRSANEAIRKLHRGYALGGSLVIDQACRDTPEQRETVERDTALLYECARALVTANRRQIETLADLVVSMPIEKGKRMVGTKRLQTFLRHHPPSPPGLDPDTGLDPCAYSVY